MPFLAPILQGRFSSLAFVGCLFAALIIAEAWLEERSDWLSRQKYEPVRARITGLGLIEDRAYAGYLYVTVTTSDGMVGGAAVRVDRVKDCKVGDPIKAERFGITLRLEPARCQAKAS